MKKIIVIAAIIISTLILTGCGHSNLTAKQQAQNPSGKEQASNDSGQQAKNTTSQKTGEPNSQQPSTPNSTAGSTAIIAKSENVMSSSDKEALLNQVDQELDSLFSNINNLEDAQDADLDLNQK